MNILAIDIKITYDSKYNKYRYSSIFTNSKPNSTENIVKDENVFVSFYKVFFSFEQIVLFSIAESVIICISIMQSLK